jgi:MscS family membrane protein
VISFQVGDEILNLATLMSMKRTAILVLLATWFVVRAVRAFADILNKWHDEKEGVELDTTAIQALTSIGVVLIWFVGIIVMLQALGMNMNALLAVGGIGGAAFAFASKDVIANFFGGLLIMFNRPFKIGDSIESGSKIAGKVTRIGLYATWLETEDGESLYVPNSIFNNSEIRNKS